MRDLHCARPAAPCLRASTWCRFDPLHDPEATGAYLSNVLGAAEEEMCSAAGVLPYRIRQGGKLEVLLGAKNAAQHCGGRWNVLGGKRRITDESARAVAIREVQEETRGMLGASSVEDAMNSAAVLWLPQARYAIYLIAWSSLGGSSQLDRREAGELFVQPPLRPPPPILVQPADPAGTPIEVLASTLLAKRGGGALLDDLLKELYGEDESARAEVRAAGGALRWLKRAGYTVRGTISKGASGEEIVLLPSLDRPLDLNVLRREKVDSLMWLPWTLVARAKGRPRSRAEYIGDKLWWSAAPNGRFVRIHPFLCAVIRQRAANSLLRQHLRSVEHAVY